jgi:hypothetical protein
MTKTSIILLLSTISIFANNAKDIFDSKCLSCHSHYIDKQKLNENFDKNNTILSLKAPTLNQLSFILKDQVGDRMIDQEAHRMELEEFIEEYIKNPDPKKSKITKHIYKFFRDSPCFDGNISDEEIELISNYIYDYGEEVIVKHSVERFSYEEALKKAQKENKIILIEGFIPYCRGCIKMDQEVMVNPKVKERLNKNFVFVKKNAILEKFPLGIKSLGTPAFYFIDANGSKVLKKVQGTGNVEEFLELLESVL